MGLNIQTTRKMSLSDFGEGWGACYLLVKGVNERKRKEIAPLFDQETPEDGKVDQATLWCLELIVGGRVINTNDDGTTNEVELTPEDVPVVVAALSIPWMVEVLIVAVGGDRLKAQMN